MRARSARQARLADSREGGSIAWRARVVGSMVGSLFLRSYERSERVYDAMRSRGYDGQLMSMTHRGRLQSREYAALAAMLLLITAFTVTAFTWMPHA